MIVRSPLRHLRKALLFGAAILALTAGTLVGLSGRSLAAGPLPCDIYGSAGTPCVAAHSTTRALFAAYNGSLYQVRRASDNATANVGLLAAGGYANAAAQDSFCANTSCVITIIYDQTSRHNDLFIEPAGTAGPANAGVPADALPVTAGGHTVYGASFSGRMGYRHTAGSGVAVNGQPEGMYMVTSGTHFNNRCCFDYGNVEVQIADTGNGHMDAIYFGTLCWFSPCFGSGPWVMADLENGLFQSNDGFSKNSSYTGDSAPFVTAVLKNNGQSFFAIKDGNAQSGGLTTRYSGALPTSRPGYSPMHQEGSIVLGTGGDNSNGSIEQQRGHVGDHIEQPGSRQERRDVDRAPRSREQLVRVVRVQELPWRLPAALELPALPAANGRQRAVPRRRNVLPTSGPERHRHLVRVVQLPDEVHPPFQQHPVHREQRRLERVRYVHLVGG